MWISICHLRSIGYRPSAPTHCPSPLPSASWKVKVWSHCSGSRGFLILPSFYGLALCWVPEASVIKEGSDSKPADHCQKGRSSLAQAHLVHQESTLAFPPVVRRIRSQEMQSNSCLAPLYLWGKHTSCLEPWLLSLQHLPKPPTSLEILFWENCLKTKITQITKTKKKKALCYKHILWDTE